MRLDPAPLGGSLPYIATAVKTSGYVAVAGDLVPVDTTSGAVTITLPTAPANGTGVAVKMVVQGGTNAVTITAGGSDVFNVAGGVTSLTLTLLNQAVVLAYKASSAIWYVQDSLALAQLDSRFNPGPLTGATAATRYVGGTTTGAPVSGTFLVGDFVVSQDGQVFICTIAGTPGTWTNATRSRAHMAEVAAGVLSEPCPAGYCITAVAPTTQTRYGVLNGLRAGDSVTGVLFRNSVAAAGTNPTTVRFGIADSTGKILALSGDYGTGGTNNATTIFPTGPCPVPFAGGAYTVLADGGYYACYIVNGTWGTTQPTPIRTSPQNAAMQPFNSQAMPNFSQAGQTDLPAVNSSMTVTAGTSGYYLAFYGTGA